MIAAPVVIAAPLVLSNLIYLAGALGLAVFISVLYVLWHRRPESVEDHMASFAKRLQALEALAAERDEPSGGPRRGAVLPERRGSALRDRRRPATAPPRTAPTQVAPGRSPQPPDPTRLDTASTRGKGQSPESHAG